MSLQFFVPDIQNNRVVIKDNSIVFKEYTTSIIQDVKKGVSTRYNTNQSIDEMNMVEVQAAYEKLYAKQTDRISKHQIILNIEDKQRMYAILERIDKILKDGVVRNEKHLEKHPFTIPPKSPEDRVNYLTEDQAWQELYRLQEKYDLSHKTLTKNSDEQRRVVLVARKCRLNVNNTEGTQLSAAEEGRLRRLREEAKGK